MHLTFPNYERKNSLLQPDILFGFVFKGIWLRGELSICKGLLFQSTLGNKYRPKCAIPGTRTVERGRGLVLKSREQDVQGKQVASTQTFISGCDLAPGSPLGRKAKERTK